MKKKLATAAGLLIASVVALTPTVAFAAPYTPDGSTPYGANTICQVTDAYDPTIADPAETNCSQIPTYAWANDMIPASTGVYEAASWDNFGYVSSVVNEGSVVGGSEDSEDPAFFVRPTDPSTLPFLGELTLSTYTGSPTPQTSVKAYFVPDNSIVAEKLPNGDPYADITTGARVDLPTGSAQPLALTPTGEDTYAVDFLIPTPTWAWETDGVLNGYGYSGVLVTVVETTNPDGEPVTLVNRVGFSVHSAHMTDTTQFLNAELQPDGTTVGVVGTGYDLLAPQFPVFIEIDPPVVEPPVVDPPVVVPPVVEPPVVDTPVAAEPVGPRVNSGADYATNPLTAWLPLGLAAALLAGMTPVLAAVRKREQEVAE